MSRTGQPAVRHVAAVERALAVVDALAEGQAELGTNEIARRTGINASTVSRLLATLANAGFVEHVAASGRYRLGLRLLELGNAVLGRLDLREIARPHLHALAELTGETATLSAPGEEHAVTVDFVQSTSTIQSVARLGRPSVAHATATGKLLLAFGGLPIPEAPERYTERTLVEAAQLEEEVAAIRERGYAEAVAEREEGLHAIAAPIWGPERELAGMLGVQGPGVRFGRTAMRAALPALVERARAVTSGLGGRVPDR